LTGKLNGITVIDFDDHESYDKAWRDLKLFTINDHPTVITRRGFHVYFKYTDRVRQPEKDTLNVDVLNDGKRAYFPGSRYVGADGKEFTYEWEFERELQPMPTKLIDYINSLCKSPKSLAAPQIEVVTSGKMDGFSKNIMDNIAPGMYLRYPTWTKFIWAIKFTFGEAAPEIAIAYSEKLENFESAEEVIAKMDEAKDARIGWGYLMNLSKQSDIKEHYRIISKHNDYLKADDYFIALSAINLIDDNVIKLDGNQFYIFKKPYWKKDNGGQLRAYICKMLREYYTYVLQDIVNDMKASVDDVEKSKMLTHKRNSVDAILFKVNSSNHSKCILDQFSINMETSTIDFDTYKPYHFCFANCAFDLRTNQKVEVKREDYITQTTGYAYVPSTPAQLAEVETLVDSVFYDSEEKKSCYISVLRSCCIGKYFEKFTLANGVGGNGKGAINELLEKMLGKEYFFKATPTTLTCDIKSGANPELAKMNKKRCVLTQEPKEGSSLNLGVIKALTGGANINARDLYSSNMHTVLQLTLMLECNKKPSFDGRVDEAIIRRFINMMFNAVFSQDEEKIEQLEGYFPMNKKYKNDVWQEENKGVLFDYLLQYDYVDIYEPKKVKDDTFKYLCENDDFTMWLDQHYTLVGDKKKTVKLKAMCHNYKETFLRIGSREYKKMSPDRFLEKLQENIKWKHVVNERFKSNTKGNWFVGIEELVISDDEDTDTDF
jgi:phage/plasmid-associated DNA primase